MKPFVYQAHKADPMGFAKYLVSKIKGGYIGLLEKVDRELPQYYLAHEMLVEEDILLGLLGCDDEMEAENLRKAVHPDWWSEYD